jgi:hypothetical protein
MSGRKSGRECGSGRRFLSYQVTQDVYDVSEMVRAGSRSTDYVLEYVFACVSPALVLLKILAYIPVRLQAWQVAILVELEHINGLCIGSHGK